jgi:hypothetical protein
MKNVAIFRQEKDYSLTWIGKSTSMEDAIAFLKNLSSEESFEYVMMDEKTSTRITINGQLPSFRSAFYKTV